MNCVRDMVISSEFLNISSYVYKINFVFKWLIHIPHPDVDFVTWI